MEKPLPTLPLSPGFEDVDLKGDLKGKDFVFRVQDLENPVAWNTLHVAMENYFGEGGTKFTKVDLNLKLPTGPIYVSPCTLQSFALLTSPIPPLGRF